MTRNRFYAAAMPSWAILYVIGIVAFHNKTFNTVGALVFALIAIVGATLLKPDPGTARQRDRGARRERRSGGDTAPPA